MAFDQLLIDRVYMIRWGVPHVSDGMALLRGVEAAQAKVGDKLIYVAIAPRDSPPPPDELRKIMASHLQSMLKYCEVMHLVFEGSGFSQTMKRMALASIVLVSGMKGRLFVHENLDQLMATSTPAGRLELSKAFRVAGDKGFLAGAPRTATK